MMRSLRRKGRASSPEGGEDSFLDIVSNMVGILIILVMIAGTRVGEVLPDAERSLPSESEETCSTPPENKMFPQKLAQQARQNPGEKSPEEITRPISKKKKAVANLPSDAEARERIRYIEAVQAFEKRRSDAAILKREVDQLNEQMTAVRRETSGAQGEFNSLFGDISRLEAVIARSMREKSDEDTEALRLREERDRLAAEGERLEQERSALAEVRPKATVLENVPTPLTKKVEGKEAVFALRGGRVSHVPIGECSGRVRGAFRSLRDFKEDQIDETIGPIDGYRFHFLGSLHKIRSGDGLQMMVTFDFGEFIPESEMLGETLADALRPDSAFQSRLALYLKESSTITLAVWPDSFSELRTLKMNLLKNGYVIALRPMPADANVTISPQGSASTIY